jgi:SAM-dependent methyltransferase
VSRLVNMQKAYVTYGGEFFNSQKDTSLTSASIVLPHVLSLINPQSVADFGCGVGTWVRALLDMGVNDVVGIDGNYISDESLVIPGDRFVRADIAQPVRLDRKFDLAISMEVAEHLPPATAAAFIDTLTRHSDVVLFSAAIPHQGGTYHVNEQWPDYWSSLFSSHGYRCVDCLRDIFWEDDRIAWWYRQNMFLFVANDRFSQFPKLVMESTRPRALPLAMVHPGFMHKHVGLRQLLKQIPGPLRATLAKRWRRLTMTRRNGFAPGL